MNRKEAEDFIYASYLRAEPYQKYENSDSQKRHPELTKAIIESLNHTPCIAVTGSKGKGSVAKMLAEVLQTEFSVGLMTSPHIEAFNERFKVNDAAISDEDFIKVVESLKNSFDEIESLLPNDVCISPMGIQAAMGLKYFNMKNTSYNVFELGKGAKYDDVNNIQHNYSVINTIFLEHTRELGESIELIAENKSYIISENQKAVFVGEQEESVLEIIEKRAHAFGVPIKIYGRDFGAENIKYTNKGMVFDVVIDNIKETDVCVPLLGEHQAKNCALALALCKEILSQWNIGQIKDRLASLEWPGRMEVISKSPLTLLDACINRNSAYNVLDVLTHMGIEKVTFIIGIPDDKDYKGVAMAVHKKAYATILTTSQNPHYKFTEVQKLTLQKEGIDIIYIKSLNEAINYGKKLGQPIVILGTTAIIADVKRLRELFS